MKLEDYFVYNPTDSGVYLLKNNKPYRRILPDDDLMVNITVGDTRIRMRYCNLVWSVANKHKLAKNEVVFHKDLDYTNNSLDNLIVITTTEKYKINEALKNLSGALKLTLHPTDAFCYVLQYRENGRLKKEVIADVVPARRKLAKLQMKFIKFVGKYVVST